MKTCKNIWWGWSHLPWLNHLANEKSEGLLVISCWGRAGRVMELVSVELGRWTVISCSLFVSECSCSWLSWALLWCEEGGNSSMSQRSGSASDSLGDVLPCWCLCRRWIGDMPWVGVVGLLENGEVLSGLRWCFMFFLAEWCQFFNAVATRSLKMVGLILEPIWNQECIQGDESLFSIGTILRFRFAQENSS